MSNSENSILKINFEKFSNIPQSELNILKNFVIIPIDKLVNAVWNYKANDDFMQLALLNNIKRTGLTGTCDVRELPTGYYEVIDGNHRLNALKELNYKYVYCYNHGSISLQDAKRIAIEKDETRFESETDKLDAILAELLQANPDIMETLPYRPEELENLLDEYEKDNLSIDDICKNDSDIFDADNIEEDECNTPEPLHPKTKLGDLYELNGHRILCGDCTKSENMQKLMNGDLAHLLFTDPPYNISYTLDNPKLSDSRKDWLKDGSIKWQDKFTDEDYQIFLNDFLRVAKENLIEYAHYYIWHASKFMYAIWNALDINDIPYDIVPITWVKNCAAPTHVRYWRQSEPCIYGGKGAVTGSAKGSRWFGKIGETNIWQVNKDFNGFYIHPTQKPLALASRAINNSTQKNEIILDCFLGSGSSLIAAEIMERKCYGTELEPKFCDMIVLRYMKYCKTHNLKQDFKLNGKTITEDYFEYSIDEVRIKDGN